MLATIVCNLVYLYYKKVPMSLCLYLFFFKLLWHQTNVSILAIIVLTRAFFLAVVAKFAIVMAFVTNTVCIDNK